MTTGAMPPGHRSLGLHGITFVHRFSHPGRSNSFWAHQEYPPNITSFPLLASSLNQSSNETLYALRPSALNPNPKDPLIFQVEVANARWGKAYPHRSIPAAETRPKGWPDCYGFSAKGSASPSPGGAAVAGPPKTAGNVTGKVAGPPAKAADSDGSVSGSAPKAAGPPKAASSPPKAADDAGKAAGSGPPGKAEAGKAAGGPAAEAAGSGPSGKAAEAGKAASSGPPGKAAEAKAAGPPGKAAEAKAAGPKAGGEAAGPRAGMSSTAKWIRPGLAVICFHYWARLVIL